MPKLVFRIDLQFFLWLMQLTRVEFPRDVSREVSQITVAGRTQAGVEACKPTRGRLFVRIFRGSLVNGFNIHSTALVYVLLITKQIKPKLKKVTAI
jgi:hypothetical protein